MGKHHAVAPSDVGHARSRKGTDRADHMPQTTWMNLRCITAQIPYNSTYLLFSSRQNSKDRRLEGGCCGREGGVTSEGMKEQWGDEQFCVPSAVVVAGRHAWPERFH